MLAGISSERTRLKMSALEMQSQWEEARTLQQQEREKRRAQFATSHSYEGRTSPRRAARDSARPVSRGQSRPLATGEYAGLGERPSAESLQRSAPKSDTSIAYRGRPRGLGKEGAARRASSRGRYRALY